MTSNAGAQSIVTPKKLGFSVGENSESDYLRMKSGVMEEVKRIFKPEFLNRIDETIVFHALEKSHVREIAKLMMKTMTSRIKDQMGLTLTVSEAVLDHLAEAGYDPAYGARPLRRTIQNEVEDMLADKYLAGELGSDKVVSLVMENGKITAVMAAKDSEE
jgi:ATP-dependent Clp protease ATP-binding subunit ClpC